MAKQNESIISSHPEMAAEWDYDKNDVSVHLVTSGMNSEFWWKCDNGHQWKRSPKNSKKRKKRCDECKSLAFQYPEFVQLWHPSKNNDEFPHKITPGSKKEVWWRCLNGHEWLESPKSLVRGKVICRKCESLVIKNPELLKEWDKTRNGILKPDQVWSGSNRLVWWKCKTGHTDHIWKSKVKVRTQLKESGCPFCVSQQTSVSNSLAANGTEGVLREWDHDMNSKDGITPHDVTKSSNEKVHWKCKNNHTWRDSVKSRVNGKTCQECKSLAFRFPDIAAEWHYEKNSALGKDPKIIPAGHKSKVYWQCTNDESHVWATAPRYRTYCKSNCPDCHIPNQSFQEITICFELMTFFKIDPSGSRIKTKNGQHWWVDIFIDELKLCIEYDGWYWHKNKFDLDKRKTESLVSNDYNVIRVRENPLKRLLDTDIFCQKNPKDLKEITNNILVLILQLDDVSQDKKKQIEEYIELADLQKETARDKYRKRVTKPKSKNA